MSPPPEPFRPGFWRSPIRGPWLTSVVTLAVVLVPVLPARLWSVIPKLFEWLPVRSVAHGLERLSLLMLVGGVIFEFATGILNIQLYYAGLPATGHGATP